MCAPCWQPSKRRRLLSLPQSTAAVSDQAQTLDAVATGAEGQVIRAQANFMTVRVPSPANTGHVELLCIVRALLKKMREKVLVGDTVRVTGIDWVEAQGVVDSVLPRDTELQNPAVANVDQVLLVFSLAEPPWDGQVATRFLVSAEAAHIPVTVLLNKADLVSADAQQQVLDEVASWGYDAVLVSAHASMDLEPLRSRLQAHTSVIVGPSGVGKSSLINALYQQSEKYQQEQQQLLQQTPMSPDRAQQNGTAVSSRPADAGACSAEEGEGEALPTASSVAEGGISAGVNGATPLGDGPDDGLSMQQLLPVGEVSSIGRGRHTTRHVSLMEVAGGLLADSPGFNQPSLTDLLPAELPECFPEIQDRLDMCGFRNCQHLQEPGCLVREDWPRHAWYVQLHAELTDAEDLARHRSASKLRRQGTSRTKTSAGGGARREALLNPKSHRRVNRKQAKQTMQDLIDEDDDKQDEE